MTVSNGITTLTHSFNRFFVFTPELTNDTSINLRKCQLVNIVNQPASCWKNFTSLCSVKLVSVINKLNMAENEGHKHRERYDHEGEGKLCYDFSAYSPRLVCSTSARGWDVFSTLVLHLWHWNWVLFIIAAWIVVLGCQERSARSTSSFDWFIRHQTSWEWPGDPRRRSTQVFECCLFVNVVISLLRT